MKTNEVKDLKALFKLLDKEQKVAGDLWYEVNSYVSKVEDLKEEVNCSLDVQSGVRKGRAKSFDPAKIEKEIQRVRDKIRKRLTR